LIVISSNKSKSKAKGMIFLLVRRLRKRRQAWMAKEGEVENKNPGSREEGVVLGYTPAMFLWQ